MHSSRTTCQTHRLLTSVCIHQCKALTCFSLHSLWHQYSCCPTICIQSWLHPNKDALFCLTEAEVYIANLYIAEEPLLFRRLEMLLTIWRRRWWTPVATHCHHALSWKEGSRSIYGRAATHQTVPKPSLCAFKDTTGILLACLGICIIPSSPWVCFSHRCRTTTLVAYVFTSTHSSSVHPLLIPCNCMWSNGVWTIHACSVWSEGTMGWKV